MNKHILSASVAGGVILLDQLSKYAVQHSLDFYSQKQIIPGLLNLTYIINYGGAFGIFSNLASPWRLVIFLIISLVALLLLFIFYLRYYKKGIFIPLSITLIGGGAISNLIDRIRFNGVIDFIDLHYDKYHWPAFNIADTTITVGTVMILASQIFAGTR